MNCVVPQDMLQWHSFTDSLEETEIQKLASEDNSIIRSK